MKMRKFSRAAACPTNSASVLGRNAASASSGVRMGVVRAGSVIMLYCIAGDRNPRLLAVFIDRIVGHETMAGLEITERDGIGVMLGARSVPDSRAAGAAANECSGVAAVAGILPHLSFSFPPNAHPLGGARQ